MYLEEDKSKKESMKSKKKTRVRRVRTEGLEKTGEDINIRQKIEEGGKEYRRKNGECNQT